MKRNHIRQSKINDMTSYRMLLVFKKKNKKHLIPIMVGWFGIITGN
jgi:hypothetical protein